MTNSEYTIETPDGEEFEIPVEGSLGLLALGDIGLLAWRSKIEQVKREMAARSQSINLEPGQTRQPNNRETE